MSSGLLIPVEPRRRRRWPFLVALAGAGVALGAGGLLAFALVERGHLAAGTHVGGIPLGERSPAEARAALAAHARRRVREPIRVVGPVPPVVTSGEELGARATVGAALDGVSEVGTMERLLLHVGLGEPTRAPLVFRPDERRVDELAAQLEAEAAVPPRDARVSFAGGAARVQPGSPGRGVDRHALVRALRFLPRTLPVPLVDVEPAVSTTEAHRAARVAEQLVASPRAVALGERRRGLPVGVLRRLVRFQPADGALAVTLDEARLRAVLRPLRSLELPARDASFRIVGRRVRVVPARSGRALDVAAVARSLVRNRRSAVHRARFMPVEPKLTTQAAQALRIRELVGEFTTEYPCCAPRVTNIQRAAEILDGTIIEPGETFSLNERLGRRTVERGFVAAPQIFGGRLEDAVGGGISQVATTLYNAAFFAGMRLDRHSPHQFYISRYPMGREATVSWGGPELVFTNDWPAAALLKVSARETSITVRLYSTKLGRRVETTTGEPYAYVAPATRVLTNRALPPGERVVVQDAGASGFTVEYTRKVYRGDRLKRNERYRVRYEAQNAFVEVGPPRPKPKPKAKPKPKTKEPPQGKGGPGRGPEPEPPVGADAFPEG